MILLQPNVPAVEINGEKRSKALVEGKDVFIPKNWDRLPVSPEGGLPLLNFLDGKGGLEVEIEETAAGTGPDFLVQRKRSIAFGTDQPIHEKTVRGQ
jgi:hypothetical protein